MKIGLVDDAFTHSKLGYSVEYVTPQKNFEWDRSCQTDIIVFTDHQIKNSPNYNTKKKIAWLIEPYLLQMPNYQYVRDHRNDFIDIFTHDIYFNVDPIILGGTWIYKKDWKIYKKTKNISIVASEKNYLAGHRMRHEVVKDFKKIDVFGRIYNPVDYKLETLKNYKYQIVIENTRTHNWFTEKLIDCFLTGTIPIYWGAQNIHEYFNLNGILVFNNLDDLRLILDNLDQINIPDEVIKENFQKAKFYSCAENQIYERILKNNFYEQS